MGSPVLFLILATIAIASALGMFQSRNAVHAALFLVLNFMTIAVFYVVLNAPFIAMVQVTVYAGAIMVLFLFVIMLLGAERLRGVEGENFWQLGLAVILTGILLLVFMTALILGDGEAVTAVAAQPLDSSPQALGLRLFEAYVFPFEITGLLLLAAMIGVVVLSMGKKKRGSDG